MKPANALRRMATATTAAALLFTAVIGCAPSHKANTTFAPPSEHVAVHDPSIVKANDAYYVFGSHRAWAKSEDLISWSTFQNNLSTDYDALLGDIWEDWAKQSANPELDGNMWAPDVIWNDTMGKWCMYMSVNGANYRSTIVLLTADDIEGDWEYVGPVVYSGFNNTTAARTDVPKVLGENADLDRYLLPTDTEINAIDPCVTFDDDGNMWMTFGSWFGGMWMLKLDPATGLRDYDTTYDTVTDQSDAYYGIKIAGGYGNSGEGSYLIHANGYWYLFASYGALQQKGGYQIRMFRSKDITGPYVDQHGNTAVSTEPITSNWTSDIGVKLMGSTQWSGSTDSIEVAQGHNSALVDDDGTVYLVYHTRFSNRGEEHEVRVRELLPTEDQWLVAAPYAYSGVTADAGGYDSNVLAGQYELVMHDKASYFMGATSSGTDSSENMGVNTPANITLNEDGTVSGDQTGIWEATDGSNQMTITLGDVTYTGDFAKLPRDLDGKEVMTFSALGDNLCIWGSQQ